jgi:HK97 family phage portal protein
MSRYQWAPPEQRALEQINDIGLAFAEAQSDLTGVNDQAIPAVYRSVQFIADSAASLPMEEYNGQVLTTASPIITAPNPAEIYHDSLSKIVMSLLMRGNAYLWIRSRDAVGNPTTAYVLNPDEVTVAWDRSKLFPVYSWRDTNMAPDKELLHISINKWPGELKGMGPIEASRSTLAGVKAENNMARELFEDNASPSGLLKVPWKVDGSEANEIQTAWETKHKGRKRPGVVSGGIEWEQLTINPVDAQFIEQRNFSVQEIGRMFGLHGSFLLVSSGDSMTYSTTESLFRMFIATTLRPTYLERIEQSFSRLLPTGHTARFNVDEVLRADLEARYRAYQLGIASGVLTKNEARALEGLEAQVGGDEIAAAPAPTENIGVTNE